MDGLNLLPFLGVATIQITLSDRVYSELKARAAANGRAAAGEARFIVETVLDVAPAAPAETEREASARDVAREKLRQAMIKWALR